MSANDASNKWANFKSESELMEDEIVMPEGLPPQDHKTPEEITLLENKLDQANLLAQSNKNDYLRVMAEMDNLRRRTERDVENAHKYGLEKLIRELLPVIDSLEKSLEHASDGNLKQGVQMTLDLFLSALRKHHVTAVDPMGQLFNPSQQEAVSTTPTNDCPPNTVLQVLQKGYLLSDRLVRPALVVVSKG
jgi:molecular chaperone GrpE